MKIEKITENNNAVVYKDYAHSPSKVSATTKAVKNQYPDRKLVACLELHTYSSLNAEFLGQYEGALDAADKAIVFYSPDAVQIKQLDEVKAEQINEAFKREGKIAGVASGLRDLDNKLGGLHKSDLICNTQWV